MAAFNCALITGRFQTLHAGHTKNIGTALNIANHVVVAIGSAQERGTERNPFSIEIRKLILEECYPSYLGTSSKKMTVVTLNDMTNENDHCHEWGDYMMQEIKRQMKAGYNKIDLVIYGNDGPASSPVQWFDQKWIDQLSFLQINRPPGAISATALRDHMILDQKAEWEKKVPYAIHKYYPILQEQLLAVPAFKKRLEKLKG